MAALVVYTAYQQRARTSPGVVPAMQKKSNLNSAEDPVYSKATKVFARVSAFYTFSSMAPPAAVNEIASSLSMGGDVDFHLYFSF